MFVINPMAVRTGIVIFSVRPESNAPVPINTTDLKNTVHFYRDLGIYLAENLARIVLL